MATITVTSAADSGVGSLRAALAEASAGDIINFAPDVTAIDLASTLTITTNVTIEGSQPGSIGTPGVAIIGGGAGSDFSDFTINAGVTATLDGLIIADGNATGASAEIFSGAGSGASGGIYDAGALTLSNSQLIDNTATGGLGGDGLFHSGAGGGAGGTAAGGVYVASTGTLDLQSDTAFGDAATGGHGGTGGVGPVFNIGGGAGGAGAISGQSTTGSPGNAGGIPAGPTGSVAGAGGAPGQPGGQGTGDGSGGGGGGGSAFADAGGNGTINGTIIDTTTLTVTNNSDSGSVFGSLRYELSIAQAGDTIDFAPNVTEIDLGSTLTISKNVTIEGSQPGSIGTPGVTIVGGGAGSNFADFTINAGVTATFDGLIIADGYATGATGTAGTGVYSPGPFQGGTGGNAAGGVYDAGVLTLSNSQLVGDTAAGGSGGGGYPGRGYGGGAGGSAAGGIYVASSGTLNLLSYSAIGDAATGGQGGGGAYGMSRLGYEIAGGAGGAGEVLGQSIAGSTGKAGASYLSYSGGAGGAPGQPGGAGAQGYHNYGGGGGGGGGFAFADVGGAGTINNDHTVNLTVTNSSDSASVLGSLRYELSIAQVGDTIDFAANVTQIDLGSTLTITKNITIEGSLPGSIGMPGVTVVGGGAGSNFADFTIDARVSATLDGLIITDGYARGATGATGSPQGSAGGAAAGGIYDAGSLTLSNSRLVGDIAVGGSGGAGSHDAGAGGGAGGPAAGGIYVASTGTLNLLSDTADGDWAVGGQGGSGSYGFQLGGGAGGFGAVTNQFGKTAAMSGFTGTSYLGYASNRFYSGGAGGAPGQPGDPSQRNLAGGPGGGGGGGGGGNAFADVGGAGTINGTITDIPCYCRGTLIRAKRGQKRVEKLKIGDMIATASGTLRPIKWIGRRSYGGRFIMGRTDILPICFKAGALGNNVPKRDLWISPHHAMYFNEEGGGVLIEAEDLVNGVSVVQAASVTTVEYFHIELDSHDIILAEGAPSESFIDEDSRGMFHNVHEYRTLYPQEATTGLAPYCAPRYDDGYVVESVRRRIALRAGLTRADAQPAGALRGYVDLVSVDCIAGWTQNVDHPEAPVCLDIYAGGRLIGQTLANRYRADLEQAGVGSGRHSFKFKPPARLDFTPDAVEVRRSLDGAPLPLTADARRAPHRVAVPANETGGDRAIA